MRQGKMEKLPQTSHVGYTLECNASVLPTARGNLRQGTWEKSEVK